MSPHAMVVTALMLGGLVATAGAYGLLYGASRLHDSVILRIACWTSYLVLGALACAIVSLTPLRYGWKALVVASAAAYLIIPPMTWRYLTRLHGGENNAPGHPERAHRARTRLYRRA